MCGTVSMVRCLSVASTILVGADERRGVVDAPHTEGAAIARGPLIDRDHSSSSSPPPIPQLTSVKVTLLLTFWPLAPTRVMVVSKV